MSENKRSEDFQLVSEAKKDPRKFGALYKKYYEKIFRYCYYRLYKNKEVTEDVVSGVFIKAMENIDSYEDQGSPFIAWLYTIARNLVIDYCKSGQFKYEGSSKPLEWASGDDNVEKNVEKKDLLRRLEHLIESLPEEDRELLALKFASGLTFKEAAQVLDINEGAAKMRYYRLLESLQEEGLPDVTKP